MDKRILLRLRSWRLHSLIWPVALLCLAEALKASALDLAPTHVLAPALDLPFALDLLPPVPAQDTFPAFSGPKTDWHGYDRYDFILDVESGAITSFTPPADEKFAVRDPPPGKRRCVIIVPKRAAPGNPWSWRGCYWDYQPQTEIELLRRGFHIAYISASAEIRPDKEWDVWYAFLTEKYGLSHKPAFVGMSRGGEFSYIWATTHPDKVSCIYGDNPAIDKESLMKLDGLAAADVPLLNVCGSIDPIFGEHTLAIENLYQQLGGRISLMIKEGFGHHPHSLRDPKPIEDWIEQNIQPVVPRTPSFVGSKFKRSNYYGLSGSYTYFPSEGAYITCRGPWFTENYDRYEFNIDGVAGAVVVTIPKREAPNKPWVYRAGFGGRDAAVDLALLAKGFYIVTGPVSFNSDSLILKDWDVVYKLMTDNGFSRKPVMEGAGGAAGEVYGWAIQHPDEVSCIYAENPVMRSTFSKAQPLDNLALLAKAGVPLLHVCGSLDPELEKDTRSVQQQYETLGGRFSVIIRDGVGHYPLAPKDLEPVVEFITKSAH